MLDWEITDWPDWGSGSTWTFTPQDGVNLTPEDGALTILVEVVAPDEKNSEFEGEILVINSNNPDDYEIISVTLATPKNKPFIHNNPLLSWLFERFPNLFPVLRQLWEL
jgi:hypothetical protein